MSDLFLETLDSKRQAVFKELTAFKNMGILGGGTAIALQINHRHSFDFDIFLSKPPERDLVSKIRSVLGKNIIQTLNTLDQMNFVTTDNVSVTFFYDNCPPLFPVISSNSINLMDLRDLASNKAFTIGFRGKWRDYVDVFFLLKDHQITLQETIEITQKRRGSEFSTRLFLQQLSYFGDVSDYNIDYIGEPILPETIKEFLTNEVKNFKL